MPAISCWDAEEVCDWFFRDPEVLHLVLSSTQHGMEAHKEYTEKMIEEALQGKVSLAERFHRSRPFIRTS